MTERTVEEILAENGNGGGRRQRPEPPTHDEISNAWLRHSDGNWAWGMGSWRRYARGIWEATPDEITLREIMETVKVAKASGIKPTFQVLRSVEGLARVEAFVEPELWDADPDLLVCANGTLHIPSRELRAHDPGYRITSGVPYDYDPDARALVWEDVYLPAVFGDDPATLHFLQEFAGYCLTTSTKHDTALWLYGSPGSGKSTFIAGLEAMLGPRVGRLSLSDLKNNQFSLGNLEGKTLMTAAEQVPGFLENGGVLNEIISGDRVKVEQKYKQPYEIHPRAKVVWAMNELPRVGAGDNGIYRRVSVVKFPGIEKQNRSPKVRESILLEGAGILNWALEGLARLEERGEFEIPESVREANQEFRDTNDPVKVFIDSRCELDPNATVAAEHLYRDYKDWCLDNNLHPISGNRIKPHWERHGLKHYKSSGSVRYRGVKLRQDIH